MEQKYRLEICCGNAADVIEAASSGADRVELNCALDVGGLTPSLGALRTAKAHADIPVMTMIRPRAGGFRYTDTEFLTMMADAEALLENGADGLVFGCLTDGRRVDMKRCEELIRLCGDRDAVFHRAIDVSIDWRDSLDRLIDLGFTRVLSSGLRPTAPEGAETLREMVDYAAGRIEILAGSGIRLSNIRALIHETGVTQVHMSAMTHAADATAVTDRGIRFSAGMPEELYPITDRALVARLQQEIKGVSI